MLSWKPGEPLWASKLGSDMITLDVREMTREILESSKQPSSAA